MELNMDSVLGILYGCIDEVNRQLPTDAQVIKSETTVIVGHGGVLDSLAIIMLLVSIEDAVNASFGVQCSLIDETNLLDPNGPYHTIGNLSKWIVAKAK